MSRVDELVGRLRFHGRHASESQDEGALRKNAEREQAADLLEKQATRIADLLFVLEIKHGSMCPANTCTCDLDETRAITADSARVALQVKE